MTCCHTNFKEGIPLKCKCGCEEFIAHQVCHMEIIVDGNNEFIDNYYGTAEDSIYEAGDPYGPYTCVVCGAEYDELTD